LYAIVDDDGRQFKVTEGQTILLDEREAEIGDTIHFDRVLLYAAGEDIRVGTPTLDGITVNAEVVAHVRGEKILVFKRKKRKGFRNTKGHRQPYLEVVIKEIKAN
jgi:large subunit ribosomal protein L21